VWPEQWSEKVQAPILEGIKHKPPEFPELPYDEQLSLLLANGYAL